MPVLFLWHDVHAWCCFRKVQLIFLPPGTCPTASYKFQPWNQICCELWRRVVQGVTFFITLASIIGETAHFPFMTPLIFSFYRVLWQTIYINKMAHIKSDLQLKACRSSCWQDLVGTPSRKKKKDLMKLKRTNSSPGHSACGQFEVWHAADTEHFRRLQPSM